MSIKGLIDCAPLCPVFYLSLKWTEFLSTRILRMIPDALKLLFLSIIQPHIDPCFVAVVVFVQIENSAEEFALYIVHTSGGKSARNPLLTAAHSNKQGLAYVLL